MLLDRCSLNPVLIRFHCHRQSQIFWTTVLTNAVEGVKPFMRSWARFLFCLDGELVNVIYYALEQRVVKNDIVKQAYITLERCIVQNFERWKSRECREAYIRTYDCWRLKRVLPYESGVTSGRNKMLLLGGSWY